MRLIAVLMLAVAFATLMYVISLTFYDVTINYKIEPLPSIPVKPPQQVDTSTLVSKHDSPKTLKHARTLPQRVDMLHVVILACNRGIELNMSLFALTQVYEKHLLSITVSLDCAESFSNILTQKNTSVPY